MPQLLKALDVVRKLMMNLINLKEAYQRLTRQSTKIIVDQENIDLSKLVDLFSSEYQNTDIAESEIETPEFDTLIFHYQEVALTKDKTEIVVTLNRKVILATSENFKTYGFTIRFDVKNSRKIDEYLIKCSDKHTCSTIWTKKVKTSSGFQKTINLKHKEILFSFT